MMPIRPTPAIGTQIAAPDPFFAFSGSGVAVGSGVGSGVTVGPGVGSGVAVGSGVGSGVAVGSGVGSSVAVGSGVGSGVAVGSGVGLGVAVGSGVGSGVAVGSGVGLGVAVGSGVGSGVAVGSGVGFGVAVGFGVGLGVAVGSRVGSVTNAALTLFSARWSEASPSVATSEFLLSEEASESVATDAELPSGDVWICFILTPLATDASESVAMFSPWKAASGAVAIDPLSLPSEREAFSEPATGVGA